MSNSTTSAVDSTTAITEQTTLPTTPTSDPTTAPTTAPTTSDEPTPTTADDATTPTTSVAPTTTAPPTVSTATVVVTSANSNGEPSTITELITSTAPAVTGTNSRTTSSSSSSSSASAVTQGSSSNGSGKGLSSGGTIAVAVVVPIVAVALIAAAILFFWRKRKQRKDAEELRRKEVEEYGYNPNNDPTLPAVGAGGSDGPFEMREEGSSGYRGWGTTAVASSGRKASTTLSGGQSAGGIGQAYSGETSPTQGANSDARSGDALMGPDGRPLSDADIEGMGAMGPAASGNRNPDINRGPSNASSSYSTAARSDGSGEGALPSGAYGAAQYYSNDQYGSGNPYNDQYGSPPNRAEMSGQPVIRDVSARRNTRIENPSHFPQQSAGISQNF